MVFAQFLETAQSNHLISVVGWGRVDPDDVDTEFWVVRNSWGEPWGEGGEFSYFLDGSIEAENNETTNQPTNQPPLTTRLEIAGFVRLPTSRARGGEGGSYNLGVEESCGWAAAGEWTPARDLGF